MIKKVISYCFYASLLILTANEACADDPYWNRAIYNYTNEEITIRWAQDKTAGTANTRGCVFPTETSNAHRCAQHDDVSFTVLPTMKPSANGLLGVPRVYPITYIADQYCGPLFCDAAQINGHMLYVRPDNTTHGFGLGYNSSSLQGAKVGVYLKGNPTWIDETIHSQNIRVVANKSSHGGEGGDITICYKGWPPCTSFAERTIHNRSDTGVTMTIKWTQDGNGDKGVVGFRSQAEGDVSNEATIDLGPGESKTITYQGNAEGKIYGWVQFPDAGNGGWGVSMLGDNNPQLNGRGFCSRVNGVNLYFGNAYQDPDHKDGANGGIEITKC